MTENTGDARFAADNAKCKTEKAMLTHARIQTALLLCLVLLLIGAGIILALRLQELEQCIDLLGDDLQTLDRDEIRDTVSSLNEAAGTLASVDMGQFNETVVALENAAGKLSGVDITALNNAVTSLKGAAGKLNDVDIDALNGAVAALKDAAGTLKNVDVEALNSLVGSLENVATKLQNAVNAITGIFR